MPPIGEPLRRFQLLTPQPIRFVVCTRTPPIELAADTFLEFAELDVQDLSARGRANALSNAKRAIANRTDALLLGCGLFGTARRQNWGYPERARRLREIGYPNREVLQRLVNRPRNVLEHEYTIPTTSDEVQDIVDLASMYLRATDIFLQSGLPFAFVFSGSSTVTLPANLNDPDPDCDVLKFNLAEDTVECRSGNGWASFGPTGSEVLGADALTSLAKATFEARRTRPFIVREV